MKILNFFGLIGCVILFYLMFKKPVHMFRPADYIGNDEEN